MKGKWRMKSILEKMGATWVHTGVYKDYVRFGA